MQLYVTEEALPAQSYYAEHWTPVYLKSDVDAALAAKDRDLADANHALLLANNSADAFKRVAEQRQVEIERLRRALEWMRKAFSVQPSEVPTEFSDIIKPTTGASNG